MRQGLRLLPLALLAAGLLLAAPPLRAARADELPDLHDIVQPLLERYRLTFFATARSSLDAADRAVLEATDLVYARNLDLTAFADHGEAAGRYRIVMDDGLALGLNFEIESAMVDAYYAPCGRDYLEVFFRFYEKFLAVAGSSQGPTQLTFVGPNAYFPRTPGCEKANALVARPTRAWADAFNYHLFASLYFVFLHELGHIALDHPRPEALLSGPPERTQAIEAEADAWAMKHFERSFPRRFAMPLMVLFAIRDQRLGFDERTMPHVHGRLRLARLLDDPAAVPPGAGIPELLPLLTAQLVKVEKEGATSAGRPQRD